MTELFIYVKVKIVKIIRSEAVKFGLRTPSLKKSVKARTTGRIKRKVKSTVNPFYGKTGMGYVKKPKQSAYNKIYNKTTVGINPLSDISKQSADHTSAPLKKKSSAIAYTKKEMVEKELIVKNRLERLIRQLLRKKSIDTKTVRQNIIIEQYTYEEVYSIQEDTDTATKVYKEAMRYLSDTTNPKVFFPRLKEGEAALTKVVGYNRKHSFLINDGENVIETYHLFIQEKDDLVKQFVHNHFSESLKAAETLKTNSGKQNRLISDYSDLNMYFDDLSPTVISMIHLVWSKVIPKNELNRTEEYK